MLLVLGKLEPTLKSSLLASFSDPLNLYLMEIGWVLYSSTWKLATWKFGDYIAA